MTEETRTNTRITGTLRSVDGRGVVRMEGTNVEEGKRMLAESGLNFTSADGMGDAATKVVALARGRK